MEIQILVGKENKEYFERFHETLTLMVSHLVCWKWHNKLSYFTGFFQVMKKVNQVMNDLMAWYNLGLNLMRKNCASIIADSDRPKKYIICHCHSDCQIITEKKLKNGVLYYLLPFPKNTKIAFTNTRFYSTMYKSNFMTNSMFSILLNSTFCIAFWSNWT